MRRVGESVRLIIADDHPLFRGALREAVSGLFEEVEIAEAGSFKRKGATGRRPRDQSGSVSDNSVDLSI